MPSQARPGSGGSQGRGSPATTATDRWRPPGAGAQPMETTSTAPTPLGAACMPREVGATRPDAGPRRGWSRGRRSWTRRGGRDRRSPNCRGFGRASTGHNRRRPQHLDLARPLRGRGSRSGLRTGAAWRAVLDGWPGGSGSRGGAAARSHSPAAIGRRTSPSLVRLQADLCGIPVLRPPRLLAAGPVAPPSPRCACGPPRMLPPTGSLGRASTPTSWHAERPARAG